MLGVHNQALDHDFGTSDKSVPCGILDEDSGQLYSGLQAYEGQ
jgi:hypothetical protein